MPREMRGYEREKRTKARRQFALDRIEFREPSSPREAAAGATSHPVKAMDPELRRLIDEALARRKE